MSATTSALSLARLATLDRAAFVAELGAVFEHAPWVADAAWVQRPFASVTVLHAAMMAVVRAAPTAQQIAFLRGHPELAGKEASAGTMTEHSTFEQSGAGLNALSGAELDELKRLNAAYAARHGFPFIIAVLGHTKAQIFDALRRRVANQTAQERDEALQQIATITQRRLAKLLAAE